MKRVVLCSRLLLLACLAADMSAAPIMDSDTVDIKDSSKLDHTIVEVLKEILKEQNKSPSKSSDSSLTELMSRSLPWMPWFMMMMMGRNNYPQQCPCNTNPYPMPGAMPPFLGHPYYGYNQQYRFPDLYPTPNMAFPQNYNQPSELNVPPQALLDSTHAQTIPNFTRSYNYFGQQPYQPYPTSPTPYYYPDHQYVTTEDLVQQPGIMQALKSRLKSELAGVATKISPVDQSQPPATQQPITAHQVAIVRKPSSTTTQQHSPAPLFATDHQLPQSKTERSTLTSQQSRSTKPSFWKQVTSAL